MKFSTYEKTLLLCTCVFIAVFALFTFSANGKTLVAENKNESAVPYYININTADKSDLSSIDGIGIKAADAIIDYRERHGAFKNPIELCRIPGMNLSKLNKIKKYIKI